MSEELRRRRRLISAPFAATCCVGAELALRGHLSWWPKHQEKRYQIRQEKLKNTGVSDFQQSKNPVFKKQSPWKSK